VIISANAIVFNEYGHVLLVQRDDTRTLAPPGGACEIDEFPHLAAVREAQEETGLTVFPIRLVGLFFLPAKPEPFLFLCYRCIPRDGELSNSAETPRAGFFKATPLPRPMLAFHQEQIQNAYDHIGGPPYWGDHEVDLKMRAGLVLLNRIIYPWLSFRRSRLGLPKYIPPPNWRVRASLILTDPRRKVFLLNDEVSDSWVLPASPPSSNAPPWEITNQLTQEINSAVILNDLIGIYLTKGEPEIEFVFSGTTKAEPSHKILGSKCFETGSLPKNLLPVHQSMIEDYLDTSVQITYKQL
jgi:ADP-ribose pyrophosphatase YjhB (NUDIX family)